MICPYCDARRTNRNKLIGVAAIVAALVGLLAAEKGCRAAEVRSLLPAPLERLCARLEAPGTPQWKRDLVPRVRERRIARLTATITCYAPGHPEIDPPCGSAWAATGVRLRWGHVAVDPSVIPLHSVLVVEGIEHLMLAVDTGGAVRGNHIDVACPDPKGYFALAKRFSYTKVRCWIIRRGPP